MALSCSIALILHQIAMLSRYTVCAFVCGVRVEIAPSNLGDHIAAQRGNTVRLREGFPVDRILILDRDPDHAELLAALLRRADRSIETCLDEGDALIKHRINDIDILILVPPVRALWKEQVRAICAALDTQFNRPTVLCALRWAPQGPADRLFGDSLGVEVQHEY